jgi:glycerol uptake facilitator-like aquaporin
MEVPNGDKFRLTVVLTEFVGIMGVSLAQNLDDGTHIVGLMIFTMIVCTQSMSGGHLNPALTLGVFIERAKWVSYGAWAFIIIVFQFLGSLCGVGIGWMLRVTVHSRTDADEDYYVPGQYPFYPKIVDETRGLPAYGQVFLAELLGSMVFILVVLNVKDDILLRGVNPIYYPICATATLVGLTIMFKEVSGGLFNPAVALSQIIWQNLAAKLGRQKDEVYWTPEYATCYILAPFVGGFMAGNIFGYQKRLYQKMELDLVDREDEEEETAVAGRRMKKDKRMARTNETITSGQTLNTEVQMTDRGMLRNRN